MTTASNVSNVTNVAKSPADFDPDISTTSTDILDEANKDKAEFSIPFIQLNMHKGIAVTANLVLKMAKYDNYICMVQEPHVGTQKSKLAGYPPGLIHYAKVKTPRAAIFVSKGLDVWFEARYSGKDLAVVRLSTGDPDVPEVMIASVYLDGGGYQVENDDDLDRPGPRVIPENIRNLVSECSYKGIPLILGIDSNAHSTLWGLETDSRGERIEEFILDHGLELENHGRRPTFVGRGTETRIDITLSNEAEVVDWHVMEEDFLSDHKAISFQMRLRMPNPRSFRPWTKADWGLFRTTLEEACESKSNIDVWSNDAVDTEASDLETDIRAALDLACPLKAGSTRYKTPPSGRRS